MTPPVPDEELQETVRVFLAHDRVQTKAAEALGIARNTLQHRLKRAAEKGFLGPAEPLPGFAIKQVTTKGADGSFVKMAKEPGEDYVIPIGHLIKGESALVDPEGRVIQKWIKTSREGEQAALALRAVVDALKDEIAPVAPVSGPAFTREDLLSQYVVTDAHIGSLAWGEECGADYDLGIAEKLLVDWFGQAIASAPASKVAVLAQLGDFLHHDGFKALTPEHGHLLDADGRFPKIVRVAIRALRQIVSMLLAKHEQVHIVMADANHDPASEVWLRELFAVLYENEPRVTVDTSPGTYSVYEFGDVSLFYHHGHKRGIKDVDTVFAGRFREIYGRTRFSYAHIGHLHSDELKSTNLMKVERHETLAAPDAYASNGGWLSGRSAKVIHYHRSRGEVGRNIVTAEMVMQ